MLSSVKREKQLKQLKSEEAVFLNSELRGRFFVNENVSPHPRGAHRASFLNAECRSRRKLSVTFSLLTKTPGCAGEFKKSFSIAYKNKTPFDTIKMRLPTALNKSKGGHSKMNDNKSLAHTT